jgi:hypothetical protein
MKFFAATLFILTAMPFNAHAAGPLGSSQITDLMFFQNGLRISGTWSDANGCGNTKSVILLNTDTNYDKAYSLVLTAFVSGKNLIGYSDKCVSVDGTSTNTIRGFKYMAITK